MPPLKQALALCVSLFFLFTASAEAATSVYANGGSFGWANTTNEANALGLADGSTADMGNGGWLAFQTDAPFTTVDMTLQFAGLTGTGTIRFYVGATNNTGWFSALTFITLNITNGAVQINSATLDSYCAGIGGCNVFIVQNISGQTLSLDSADLTANLVAPNPEPTTWAMMIVAFVLLALRLKALKRKTKNGWERPLPAAGRKGDLAVAG